MINAAPHGQVGVPSGAVVSLPGGRTITLEQLQKLREAAGPIDEEANPFLGRPELLMRDPKPDQHFGWPLRNTATQGRCRQGVYRVVQPSELRDDCPFAVNIKEHADGSGQVEWENHILVEIRDDYYKSHFIAPQWRGTEQLARLRDRMAAKADSLGLDITPTVSATQVTGF